VLCRSGERRWVEEFFHLFKTPWEFYDPRRSYSVLVSTTRLPENARCLLAVIYSSDPDVNFGEPFGSGDDFLLAEYRGTRFPLYGKVSAFHGIDRTLACVAGTQAGVAVEIPSRHMRVIRAGYGLFAEVAFLLSSGQPDRNALMPTLDVHISVLRSWIVESGIPLVEIPPTPPGYDFICCLTHDVDFVRITDHKFDHTLLGFMQRASIGSFLAALRGKASWSQCIKNFKALASLPAVYLGLSEDFWARDFERFMDIERDTKATYFFIPFKGRPGKKVTNANPQRRAAAYDVTNEGMLLQKLASAGNEIAVHGIDAWHSAEHGRREYSQIFKMSCRDNLGVRMHWLCFDESSPQMLEQAGFSYDSSIGYNSTVGFRAGTHQVFIPNGATTLLELPLHIQDIALMNAGQWWFRPPDEAFEICKPIIDGAAKYGGVLTLLWHTRSLAPEREWGQLYLRLLSRIKARRVWFGSACQVIDWFRSRRAVSFGDVEFSEGRVRLSLDSSMLDENSPRLTVRIHDGAGGFKDIAWMGESILQTTIPERVRC
jgi:hypothetical protein